MTWRRPTFATVVALLFGCVVAAGHPSAASGQTPAGGASVVASHRATLDEYCVGCHNERLTSGETRLDTLDLADVAAVAESWERVIVKLRSESMPPPGRPRPDPATYRTLAAWLENEIDVKAGESPHPGRPETFHRLNRAEYGNAIRDLLALSEPPTAIFSANYNMTMGALRWLREHDVEVPRDLSLVSFDDVPAWSIHPAGITAVGQSSEKLADAIASVLLERLENGPQSGRRTLRIDANIILRGSARNPTL